MTISGTNFTSGSEVKFGATSAAAVEFKNSGELVAKDPSGSGAVHVTVTTAGGTSTTSAADEFTYRATPTVTAVSPNEGPTGGATTVKISGSDFTSASEVKFGTNAAASVEFKNAGELIAKSPSGTGSVDVRVKTAGGTSATSSADEFIYRTTPTVTAITPNEGPTGGATTVKISGSDFTSASEVKFGTNAAASVEFKNAGELIAKSPSGSGSVDVIVKTAGGTSTTSSADEFTYRATPTVTGITPKEGPTAGATSVTISGTNFTSGSEVKFGATSATAVEFKTSGELVAKDPSGSGAVHVTVTTAGGTSTTSAADEFTYRATPTVTAVNPDEGPTGGATMVKISGTNFTSGSEVKFGATSAASVEFKTSGELVAKSPSGTGSVDVCVSTAGGSNCKTSAFTYVPGPAITSISPNEGPTAGGTGIAIKGTNFTSGSEVKFGATAAAAVEFKNSGELVAKDPSGSGAVHVTVTTAGGTSTTSAADEFTYRATPTVTGITPKEGPTAGATSVTISGTNFTSASEVKFGATSAASVEFKTSGELVAKDPSGSGAVHVTVTTAGGTSTTSAADEFTYREVPTVTAITPNEGPTAGGTTVTISGTNFTSGTAVKFGTTDAASVEFKNAGELIAKSPSGTGSVDVRVKTAGGTSATSGADLFTYREAPTITAIAQTEGPSAGGTSVKITGTNFTSGSEVKFGGSPATKVEVNSATEIHATTPSGSGSVDVFVTTAGGTAATSAGDEFTYRGVPKVTSVAPKEGPEAGGTTVTINGENLEAAKEVTFGGTKATIRTDTNDAIEAVSPEVHTAGAVHVVVTTAGGISTSSAADEFTYRATPAVTAIKPTEGPTAGGTSVTISGTNFTSGSEVKFGSSAATAVEFKNTGELVAKDPAGSGAVHVTVTTAGGSSLTSTADEFTYRAVPTVAAITPNEGPTAGGTSVTITGTNFTSGSEVKFGASAAAAVEFKNAGELIAKDPSGSGSMHVTVTTAGGTSATSPADEFTYRVAPTVTLVSPATGITTGGKSVTITGSNLTKATTVTFGGALASIAKDSAGELEVVTPAHAEGVVEVCVTTAGGTSCKPSAFTYEGPPPPPPVVQSVLPSEGSTGGATPVKISGEDLDGATAVKFGGVSATISKDNATEIEVLTPPHAEGFAEVCVTTGGGTNCKPTAFKYVIAPTLKTLTPKEGPEAGGTPVKLTGEHLAGTSAVEFAGTKAAIVKNTETEVEVDSPGRPPGAAEVCIVTPGGRSCIAGAFTYRAVPSVNAVTASEGPVAGGISVTITGEHLAGATEVKFGTTAATSLEVKSESELAVKVPAAHEAGTVEVFVKTAGGESVEPSAAHFTYRVAPSVSSVSPKEGPATGGATVVIKGEHLEHASEVRFGLVKATKVEPVSEGELRATSPKQTPGAVDVVVVTPGGQSSTDAGDRYNFVAQPVVKSVRVNEGRTEGGSAVVVTGEHLDGATVVSFGEKAGTGLTVVSSGELTVKSPAHAAGMVDIVVTTPGGESEKEPADHFTYVAPAPQSPKIISISPTQGSTAGGTAVTIHGEFFEGATHVRFGAVQSGSVSVISSTELIAVSPTHEAGTVGIVVSTPGGESANGEWDFFTYVPPPTALTSTVATTTTSAAPPVPVLAKTGNVAPVSGVVLVELPGTTTFVPLTSLKQVPFGTVIEATHGRVSVTTAGPHGGTQTGEFFDGEFILSQGANGLVVATLTGGNFAVCPRHGKASKARHASASAKHASSKHVVRKLWANAHGSFSTKGNYAAGAVQGTEWLTEDLCDGTLIRVTRDKVRVTDLVNHRHFSVKAGHQYLAKAP